MNLFVPDLKYVNNIQEVVPHLFIGGFHGASNLENLKKNKITHIVDLSERHFNFPSDLSVIQVDINDCESSLISAHFGWTNKFIHDALHANKKLLHDYRKAKRRQDKKHVKKTKKHDSTCKKTLSYSLNYDETVLPLVEPTYNNVLVCCFAGRSRSATIVLAYLIHHKHYSLESALELLKSARPIILPNYGFMQQLVVYEKKIHKRR